MAKKGKLDRLQQRFQGQQSHGTHFLSSQTNAASASVSTAQSVTEQLNAARERDRQQRRLERQLQQLRLMRRGRTLPAPSQSHGQHASPASSAAVLDAFMAASAAASPAGSQRPRYAGPAPPPSWNWTPTLPVPPSVAVSAVAGSGPMRNTARSTAALVAVQQLIAHRLTSHRSDRRGGIRYDASQGPSTEARQDDEESGSPPSLMEIAAHAVGRVVHRLAESDQGRHAIQRLPPHIKELVMSHARRLTDAMMPLFCDADMGVCHLVRSHASLAGLAVLLPPRTGLDDRMAELRLSDRLFEDVDLTPDVSARLGQTAKDGPDNDANDVVDSWEQLEDGQAHQSSSAAGEESGTLFRGYRHLDALCMSYSAQLPGIPSATLIVTSAPLLRFLDISACFDDAQGPVALDLLVTHLPYLEVLGLRHCGWIKTELLDDIDWETRLQELRILDLAGCPLVDTDAVAAMLRHRGRLRVHVVVE
ncbi:hypothetical protein BC831DRAFT_484304 [Entophlyctis helioformis]|nr:hypothetical protein BC831DRAFT_484304 [Entophlyctis helioformis]